MVILLTVLFIEIGAWHRVNEKLAVYGSLVGGGRLAGFFLFFFGYELCIGIVYMLNYFAKKAIASLKRRKS